MVEGLNKVVRSLYIFLYIPIDVFNPIKIELKNYLYKLIEKGYIIEENKACQF